MLVAGQDCKKIHPTGIASAKRNKMHANAAFTYNVRHPVWLIPDGNSPGFLRFESLRWHLAVLLDDLKVNKADQGVIVTVSKLHWQRNVKSNLAELQVICHTCRLDHHSG